MIDKKELRIGNLVAANDEIIVIQSVGIYASWCKYLTAETLFKRFNTDMIPIPLTTEILDKLGFETVNGSEWTIQYTSNERNPFRFLHLGVNCNGRIFFEFGFNHVWVASVHQLQNLFFSLTGQELDTSKLLPE